MSKILQQLDFNLIYNSVIFYCPHNRQDTRNLRSCFPASVIKIDMFIDNVYW